jgi:hypothetical protein
MSGGRTSSESLCVLIFWGSRHSWAVRSPRLWRGPGTIISLRSIEKAIPNALPLPVPERICRAIKVNVTVVTPDEQRLTYGSCGAPPSINRLRWAMYLVASRDRSVERIRVLVPSSRPRRFVVGFRGGVDGSAATDELEERDQFKADFRYHVTYPGFAARLTSEQAQSVREDPRVLFAVPERSAYWVDFRPELCATDLKSRSKQLARELGFSINTYIRQRGYPSGVGGFSANLTNPQFQALAANADIYSVLAIRAVVARIEGSCLPSGTGVPAYPEVA